MEPAQPFLILVVDDEPPIGDLLARIAQKEFPQARFVNTRSVQETYDYLDQHSATPPQLILLDIDLGTSVSGLDFLPRLNEHLKGKAPIVMLTGLAETPTVKQAYERGAVAFTRKPEDLQGWRTYVATLRSYWYDTTVLPTTAQP